MSDDEEGEGGLQKGGLGKGGGDLSLPPWIVSIEMYLFKKTKRKLFKREDSLK